MIAAAFTVLQMRISDDRSEARHKQAMKLQVRADSLRYERMYFALHTELANGLRIFARSFRSGDLKTLFVEINDACFNIDRAFKSQTYREAADLLGGNLTIAIADYRRDVDELRRRVELARQSGFDEEPQSEDSQRRRNGFLEDSGNFCLHVRQETGYLIRELQGLLEEYRDG